MTTYTEHSGENGDEVVTILRSDGTQMTFRVLTPGGPGLSDALEAMSEQNRTVLKDIIDRAEVAVADIEPRLADIPDALTSRVPNPATPTVHISHDASAVSGTSVCPWCGKPIALSRASNPETVDNVDNA